MRKIPVAAVADGMVLARPVEDRLGRTLLAKGDALFSHDRGKLTSWGIAEVVVEGEADGEQELDRLRVAGAASEEIALSLERRFAAFGESHLVMTGLKLLALKHLRGGV